MLLPVPCPGKRAEYQGVLREKELSFQLSGFGAISLLLLQAMDCTVAIDSLCIPERRVIF